MNILIIGASGLVGSNLMKSYQEKHVKCTGSYFEHKLPELLQLDLSNISEIKQVLRHIRPNVILSPAALPNVDYCEAHPDQNWQQNVINYQNLINAINTIDPKMKLVYFSSDYIFDGKNGPYSEDAKPNPINEYGRAKLQCEKLIQEHLESYLIIRTTLLFGLEFQIKNFVVRLIQQNKMGNQVKVPIDQIGTPTYVNDLVEATIKLVERNGIGIFNVVGPELMSRFDFALKVCQIFDLVPSLVVPVQSSELNQRAKRPLKLGLEIEKLNRFLKQNIMFPVSSGLVKMKNEMEKAKK